MSVEYLSGFWGWASWELAKYLPVVGESRWIRLYLLKTLLKFILNETFVKIAVAVARFCTFVWHHHLVVQVCDEVSGNEIS